MAWRRDVDLHALLQGLLFVFFFSVYIDSTKFYLWTFYRLGRISFGLKVLDRGYITIISMCLHFKDLHIE